MKTKIRLINENEIIILYEHLKEFLNTSNASTTGNPLPNYEDSEKFVLIIAMILGRLELLVVMALFMPILWRD